MGPVQVLVVAFDGPTFSGEVLREFAGLHEAGIVHLVDVLLMTRGEDGTIQTVPPPEGLGAGSGTLASAFFGKSADDDESAPADIAPADLWSVADACPPGSLVAVALIEHTWAQPLVAAIHHAGGTAVEETWLPPVEVERLETMMASQPL